MPRKGIIAIWNLQDRGVFILLYPANHTRSLILEYHWMWKFSAYSHTLDLLMLSHVIIMWWRYTFSFFMIQFLTSHGFIENFFIRYYSLSLSFHRIERIISTIQISDWALAGDKSTPNNLKKKCQHRKLRTAAIS